MWRGVRGGRVRSGPWDIWGGGRAGLGLPPGSSGPAHPQLCSVGGAGCVLGRDPPCCCAPPTPKPQESSWLSPGILDVVVGGGWPCRGTPRFKGPCPGPLSVAVHTAPLAGAWPAWESASAPSTFSQSLSSDPGVRGPPRRRRLQAALRRARPGGEPGSGSSPLQPSPWAPTLFIPCPAPPPARLPGTRGPWRFLDQIELPGWFFPFCFVFGPSRVGERGEEVVIGPAPAQGWRQPWLPRWKCDPQPLPRVPGGPGFLSWRRPAGLVFPASSLCFAAGGPWGDAGPL